MQNSNSEILEDTLSKKDLHELWVKTYYSGRNIKFYELAFEKIFQIIKVKKNSKFLDAGCGNGIHSIKLAEKSNNITSIDFSDEALKLARGKINEQNVSESITLMKENMLSLSFNDSVYDSILCWGVLMHIPDIEKALFELSRVLKPNGYLVLSENNKTSIQTFFARAWKSRRSQEQIEINSTGICFWSETEAGKFLVRKTDINWLNKYLNSRGLKLVKRFPGQFTSLYTRVDNHLLKNIIYLFNELWFRFIKISTLSEGNILIFIKQKEDIIEN
jgi:ubiquinone/menaquinone biosynthesis C-methylase UbiE